MVSTIHLWTELSRFEPWPGHCVVFLDNTHKHNLMLGVTLLWLASNPGGSGENTPGLDKLQLDGSLDLYANFIYLP